MKQPTILKQANKSQHTHSHTDHYNTIKTKSTEALQLSKQPQSTVFQQISPLNQWVPSPN